MLTPFKIAVPQDTLQEIRARIAHYPWGYMPDDGGWHYGTNLNFLKVLCKYWLEDYDWYKHELTINRFPQFVAQIDGIDIHFIHEKGSGSSPKPLLLSHGWPGSIVEFLNIIEPLAHPERVGGNIEDAFDVIVPSLPGFGFSQRPLRPMGPRAIARIFNDLMTKELGYTNYIAQGGDWGSAISSWLGYEHFLNCKAIHINFFAMRHIEGPQTSEEELWASKIDLDQALEGGYRLLQETRPQTLSYAMDDSPVGVAAWIIEKFHAWSDIDADDLEAVHSKDILITNIMIYLVTRTFNSASWIYFGRREEGGRLLGTKERRVEIPTGIAEFPREILAWPPRSYAERLFNITHWTKMPRGGHFPAMEQPHLLIEDIRKFARTVSL